ncbi:IclR family transcriptional regulator [Tsukamurella soli]|uniref:IclR family transcriptional regulator n=1 Tax=Tsukamurella soli TaxID=644556 RepID=UPI0036179DEE
MSASPKNSRTGAQAVERAIAVMYAFRDEPGMLTVSEVAERVGLSVSTCYRIMQALVRGRLLVAEGHGAGYRLGVGISELARSRPEPDVESAAPHLHGLAADIGITASISVAEERQAVTLYSARPPIPWCSHQTPDERSELGSTAMGRAIVIFGGHGDLRAHALSDAHDARRRGFTVGVRSGVTSVAVPVFDMDGRARASIGIQARSARLTTDLISDVLPG